MKYEVRGNLPLGSQIVLDDQSYRLTGTRPHQRQDGTTITLMVWSSSCPNCGDPFEATMVDMSRSFARRCEPCRKIMGGVRVKGGAVAAVLTLPDSIP